MTGSIGHRVKIFDRSAADQSTPLRTVSVDRRHVIQFSEAIGETNPVYLNKDAAQKAGYDDVIAPPTFAAVIDMAVQHDMRRDGEPDVHQLINGDYRFLLHGEEHYEYQGHIFAGDRIVHQTRVLGFSDAAGGSIELAHLETLLTHAERGVLVRCKRTLVHNLKNAGHQ